MIVKDTLENFFLTTKILITSRRGSANQRRFSLDGKLLQYRRRVRRINRGASSMMFDLVVRLEILNRDWDGGLASTSTKASRLQARGKNECRDERKCDYELFLLWREFRFRFFDFVDEIFDVFIDVFV